MQRVLEAQIGQPLEVRMRRRNELTHVIVGAHANYFEQRVIQEPSQELGSGEPRSPQYRDFGLHPWILAPGTGSVGARIIR